MRRRILFLAFLAAATLVNIGTATAGLSWH